MLRSPIGLWLMLLVTIPWSPTLAFQGTDLYSLCNTPSDPSLELACISYVRGVMDGLVVANEAGKRGIMFCPPQGYTIEQGRVVIQKFMRDHPEELAESAGAVATTALYVAFRCAQTP